VAMTKSLQHAAARDGATVNLKHGVTPGVREVEPCGPAGGGPSSRDGR